MDLDGRGFFRQRGAFVPADFAAEEMLASVPLKREGLLSMRRPRSPLHHRWFFALMRKVIETMPDGRQRWTDEKALLKMLKLEVGHVDPVWRLDGTGEFPPAAINFASMSEDEFIPFRDQCLSVLAGEILHCDPLDLMREVDATQEPHP